jgi:hypothetical protein
MAATTRFQRWRWALGAAALMALLAVGAALLPLPLRASDKAQAARDLVAWVVEGRQVPGFGEPYPDAQWMPDQERFFVVCDFVPSDVPLSDDPRVQRVTAEEREAAFKKHRFQGAAYLHIGLRSESGWVLVVEFTNAFGSLGAHGYRFEFRRKLLGLRADGKLQWVS